MRLDINDDGSATCKRMKDGAKARGMRAWSRTGGLVPRAFRDDARYTLDHGKHRDSYTTLVSKMLERHPRSKPLKVFLKFLNSPKKAPVSWNVEKALYVPYYNNRPVMQSVVSDYDDVSMDPYGPGPFDGREQTDVITGEKCIVPNRRPIRVLRIGTGTGVTLISVKDEVTASHWRSDPKLQAPMSERTMNLCTAALQSLVNRGGYTAAWRRKEEVLRYYTWTEQDSELADVVQDVLAGNTTLAKVESWAKKCARRKENLYVLGLYGGKRLCIMNWHHLPLSEASEAILAYARKNSWKNNDGDFVVMGMSRIGALTVPFHRCLDGDRYNPKVAREISNSILDWQSHAALVDHIIEGDVFPATLHIRIQTALSTRNHDASPRFRAFVQDQLTVLGSKAKAA